VLAGGRYVGWGGGDGLEWTFKEKGVPAKPYDTCLGQIFQIWDDLTRKRLVVGEVHKPSSILETMKRAGGAHSSGSLHGITTSVRPLGKVEWQ